MRLCGSSGFGQTNLEHITSCNTGSGFGDAWQFLVDCPELRCEMGSACCSDDANRCKGLAGDFLLPADERNTRQPDDLVQPKMADPVATTGRSGGISSGRGLWSTPSMNETVGRPGDQDLAGVRHFERNTHGGYMASGADSDWDAPRKGAADHHMAVCKELMELQVSMALTDLTTVEAEELGKKMASFFAPVVEWKVNPNLHGPRITGNFACGVALIGPLWAGVANRRTVNAAFTVQGKSVIQVLQLVDMFMVDDSEQEVSGTKVKGFQVIQTMAFDVEGKINAWTQEYDDKTMQALRARVSKAVRSRHRPQLSRDS